MSSGLDARPCGSPAAPATAAIEAVVSWAAATRRSRIPVRAHDPLVGRVDHPLEVGVGQDLARGVPAPAGDVGAAAWPARVRGVVHSGSTSMRAASP